ncbi:putative serine/threonine-protein kinase iks1 [Linnemannia exigua]|uniref:non-specific serine/threonine protein kinase n=1 Tax=Linnemannia exigua TaxID=604196 RepID=A0AAD4H4T2_9FUNG|nr:putative serine/threonine-protein kinase iks1 [Linnemannia exigua]
MDNNNNNTHEDDAPEAEKKNDLEQQSETHADSRHPQLHPLQAQHQQQPWLIPHPNLPIAWHNNDHTSQGHGHGHSNRDYNPHYTESSYSGQHPPQSRYLLRFKDPQEASQRRPDSTDTRPASSDDSDWLMQHYHESVSDQGHESDPSELMRSAVLFSSSPPTHQHGFHTATQRGEGSDRSGRKILPPVRRTNRSMSLSMSPHVWQDERSTTNDPLYTLPSSSSGAPFPARGHREMVPYSQEWRVILRSPPRGRTVLYNPQMQSLVVQTTVGPDSHPMSLRSDSRICALCRRPLDLDDPIGDQAGANSTSGFMDTNYFRMLADANIALSRRGSLQGNTEPEYPEPSPIGSPTSSGRASLDIDSQAPPLDDTRNRTRDTNNPAHLSHDALNQGYYERFFVEQMKLGRGYRGSVFLCQHILDGIHLGEYAIKKVAVGDNHDWLVQMLREVHLLERLHHPNIVAYKHAWLENHQLHKFGPEVTCLFILMECANGGNLEEYIERPAETQPRADVGTSAADGSAQGTETKRPMSARERLQSKRQQLQGIWSFFFDICEGLGHLHRLGIIHRDLKPPNLLLSYSSSQIKGTKGERPRILITDFGECEISDQAAKRDRTGATGTLEFLAPELLAVDANGRYTDEFSFKGDMWSLGMVLYYLCYSRLPYSQIDDVDILKEEIREFKSITLPADDSGDRVIPEELKILVRVLLSTDKSKRPSCDDILSMLSPQRDRMMHGNMDSPTTTTFRATPSTFSSQPSTSHEERDGIRKEDSDSGVREDSTVESQQPISKGLHSLASHRQHYYSPTLGMGRRRSRATLVTDNSRTAGSGQAPHSPATGTRNTASPSSNLHKRVKPLGLGLRHMLRRRMMHPAAITGAVMYKYPRSEQGSPAQGSSSPLDLTLKPRMLKSIYPVSSPGLEMMRVVPKSPLQQDSIVAVAGQRQTDLFQQQQYQSRKYAASGKGSNIGLAVELNPQSSDSVEGSEPSGFTGGSMEEVLSGGPRRSSSSRHQRPHTGARRKSHQQPVFAGSSSRSINSSGDRDTSNSKQKRHRDAKDRYPPRRENLDSDSEESSMGDDDEPLISTTHRRELSGRKQQQEDVIGRTGAMTKVHMPLGKAYWSNLASAHARDVSRSESGRVGSIIDGDNDPAVADVGELVENQGIGASGSSGSETDDDDDEEEEEEGGLGSYVTTVVWDRYVLSLISERFLRRKKKKGGSGGGSALSSRRRRRRSSNSDRRVEHKGDDDSVDHFPVDFGASGATIATTVDAATLSVHGDINADADADKSQGSVVLKTRDTLQENDQEEEEENEEELNYKSNKLIWQALLSGVVIQVVWVCLVWLFSRGRICAV